MCSSKEGKSSTSHTHLSSTQVGTPPFSVHQMSLHACSYTITYTNQLHRCLQTKFCHTVSWTTLVCVPFCEQTSLYYWRIVYSHCTYNIRLEWIHILGCSSRIWQTRSTVGKNCGPCMYTVYSKQISLYSHIRVEQRNEENDKKDRDRHFTNQLP